MERDIRGFEEYVAVHYAKRYRHWQTTFGNFTVKEKTFVIFFWSFYFWKLGPLPRLFSFLELVLFGWTKFKVETHKFYWPVRDPTSCPFMYHLTDLTEIVLL